MGFKTRANMVLDEREVKDDNIDQYIRDILELIKSQMPNGFYQNLPIFKM